jgi:hypothetical protein
MEAGTQIGCTALSSVVCPGVDKMKLLGKGAFSRVYAENNQTVIIHSICPVKEAMSLGWITGDRFPVVERLEPEVYRMKRYDRWLTTKNLCEADKKLYTILRRIYREYSVRDNVATIFEPLRKDYPSEYEQLVQACYALANYSDSEYDIRFEISPRNIAVDNGKLIFLDVFYLSSVLESDRRVTNSLSIIKQAIKGETHA